MLRGLTFQGHLPESMLEPSNLTLALAIFSIPVRVILARQGRSKSSKKSSHSSTNLSNEPAKTKVLLAAHKVPAWIKRQDELLFSLPKRSAIETHLKGRRTKYFSAAYFCWRAYRPSDTSSSFPNINRMSIDKLLIRVGQAGRVKAATVASCCSWWGWSLPASKYCN